MTVRLTRELRVGDILKSTRHRYVPSSSDLTELSVNGRLLLGSSEARSPHVSPSFHVFAR